MLQNLELLSEWWMLSFWHVSVQAAFLIILIGFVAWLCRRTSPVFRYSLWCIVLIRLCLPFEFSTPWGVGDEVSGALANLAVPLENGTASKNIIAVAGESSPIAAGYVNRASVNASTIFAGSWLMAAGLLGAVILWRAYRCRRRLAPVNVKQADLLGLLEKLKERIGLRRAVNICQFNGELADGPFLMGLFSPQIVLPSRMVEKWPVEDLEPVLLHELVHVQRHDPLVNALQILIQTLYFFHPLVWLVNARIRQLREEICDDVAIGHLERQRKRYGNTLLRVVEESHRELAWTVPLLGIGERRNSLGRRLVRIMSNRYMFHRELSLSALAMLAVIAVIAFGATSGNSAGAVNGPGQKLFNKAELLYKQEQYENALSTYRQVYTDFPNSANAEYAMMMEGICLDWLGEKEKAIHAFEATLAKYPKSSATYFYLGMAHNEQKNEEKALENFRKCAELSKNDQSRQKFPYQEALGWISLIDADRLFESQQYAEAAAAYLKISQDYPEWNYSEHALMMIGMCHESSGDIDKAREAFIAAISRFPNLAGWTETTHFRLGRLYENAGDVTEAIDCYRRCIGLCEESSGRKPDAFPWREASQRLEVLKISK